MSRDILREIIDCVVAEINDEECKHCSVGNTDNGSQNDVRTDNGSQNVDTSVNPQPSNDGPNDAHICEAKSELCYIAKFIKLYKSAYEVNHNCTANLYKEFYFSRMDFVKSMDKELLPDYVRKNFVQYSSLDAAFPKYASDECIKEIQESLNMQTASIKQDLIIYNIESICDHYGAVALCNNELELLCVKEDKFDNWIKSSFENYCEV
ncbi:hypothetical protein Cyrtocomes_00333 [Candidatus Cyrtobacter comes]|uniref:Uncharacterized protein n=1 Tax=Candidatus Cyrtobacter comes TaxID=675776 RepID=A0ABU5L773_9RICK|nr:hypothetical protein [Candidatus Cyrtobacter comes]MDZ5761969.1 hypothetical protein [Candidatus Cyrtobacter comes]